MKYPVNVSVVIPAFNAADTIARALDSVLIQTYPASEIVVVDDCSSDDTRSIVERYTAKGVRLLALPQRRGASGARNAGIAAATGEAVVFLEIGAGVPERARNVLNVNRIAPRRRLVAERTEGLEVSL